MEIQHFLHKHPLSLFRKGNHKVFCNGCKQRLSGTTYGCTKCMFFLHKSCSELQPTIQNFFHPCPLVLNISSIDGYYCYGCFDRGSGFRYICKYKCSFQMHVDCALKPPMESEDAEDDQSILHFTHRHPLKPVNLNKEDKVDCAICEKLCFDSSYGCKMCNFFLHNTCMATIPRKVNNFFHSCPLILFTYPHFYTCAGCYDHKPRSSLTFSCEKCHFRLDPKCALLPTVKSTGAYLIQHFTHNHPLRLVDSYKGTGKSCCDVCGEIQSAGFAYICKKCDFYGHKSCITEVPRQINHLFHPCPLTVVTTAHYRCRGCDEECLGFSFCCEKCNFYLDGKCALLPTANSEGAKAIQHFTHHHPLNLLQEAKGCSSQVIRCKACGENWSNTTFGCGRCNFFLHRSCAIELAPRPPEIRHYSHTKHPLTLLFLPYGKDNTPCAACCKKFDRVLLAYRCSKCDFNLHIDCVRHIPFVKYKAHRHLLTLFDNANHLTCHICWQKFGNFVLRCVLCNFNMHLQCHPSVPKTIDHEYHIHSLSLTKSPFPFELNIDEDAYNSDDEFYCDLCEGKRYKPDSVYYCGECRFIAEIKCVIDKVYMCVHILLHYRLF